MKSSYPYDLINYFKFQARRAGWPKWQVQQVINEATRADKDKMEQVLVEVLAELN